MAAADKQRYERELKEYNEKEEMKRQEAMEVAGQMVAVGAGGVTAAPAEQQATMMMVDASGVILPIGLSGAVHESATAALADAMAAVPDEGAGGDPPGGPRRSLEPMFQP
mmetsp:Transcript_17604/g.38407  ORF Transcript_17604/g.38407 Transcript_17604/m.38407 type:complete len:110 (-) Transcript_17604:495-824(-)